MDVNLENTKRLLASSKPTVARNVTGLIELFNKIKWKKIAFTIPLKPTPSKRPRLGFGRRVYVPGAAKNAAFFERNMFPLLKDLFISTPCKIKLDIYMETPKSSFTKAQHILAEMKILRPWGSSGDVDNFEKSVYDMMQPNEKRGHHGIMSNDCLIIEAHTNKYYSMTPRYELEISYMDNIDEELIKPFRFTYYDEHR